MSLALGFSWVDGVRSERLPPSGLSAGFEAEAGGAEPAESSLEPDAWTRLSGRLARGETLGSLVEELGVESGSRERLLDAAARVHDLRKLRAGSPWKASRGPLGLEELALELGAATRLIVTREPGSESWSARVETAEETALERTLEGQLQTSLEAAVLEVGGSWRLANAMADLLAWELDLERQLRPGDRFQVLWEERVRADGLARFGKLLALRFESRKLGRTLEWFRYREALYDGEGNSAQKQFLRSPLPHLRVSSGFSRRRLHPVLHVHRPHWGIDLPAPHGTPVRATATGEVISAAWEGGGGKTVRLRHAGGYVTSYLHLSGFAPGVARGRRLAQGDVLGYVGSTGLATAPHLDYRVQRHGRYLDPLSFVGEKFGSPLEGAELEGFRAARAQLLARLEARASGEERIAALLGLRQVPGGAGGQTPRWLSR